MPETINDFLGVKRLPEFLPIGKKSNVPTYLTKDLVWVACKKHGIVLGLLSIISFRGIEVAIFHVFNMRMRLRKWAKSRVSII